MIDKVEINEECFTLRSILQPKGVTIKYDDINALRFGWLMNTIEIKTNDQKAIFDITLSNSYTLLNIINEKTTKELHESAFEQLGTFYKLILLRKNLEYLNYFTNKKKD